VTASIAVVTKRAGLTLTMNSATHRFVEIRPVAGWLERQWAEQVVVLDLESAEVTLAAIETLTAAGVDAPIIVIATDTDGWDELLSLHPDLSLVSLPIMPAALLSAVDRAVRRAQLDPTPASVVATTKSSDLVVDALVVAEPEPAVDPGLSTGPFISPKQPTTVPPPRPRKSQAAPAATSAVAVTPTSRVEAPEPEPRSAQLAVDPRQALMKVVRTLQHDVVRLGRVPEVAEVLRHLCVSAVACDASAVLVPDGDVWRVSASAHLRPLEERLQISSDHWLVTEVVEANSGVLIKNTDIARTRLSGSPLASWPNLMALPVAEARALVLLARQDKGFNRKDLVRARQEVDSYGRQLLDAIDVRDLARKMIEFVNLVD